MLTAAAVWVLLAIAAPYELGTQRELFVDSHLIERIDSARLSLQPPIAAEVALVFDRPWEGAFCGYVTVFQDGPRYRMYYRGLPEAGKDGSAAEVTCYAESADGIAWQKPALGLYDAGGSTANNIVLADAAPFSHNFAPFLDARPGVDASERYKAIAGTVETGLFAWASGDGLRWRKLHDAPVLREGAFDSQNVAFWSSAEQRYVCYYRTWSEGDFGGYRSVSRAESTDFRTWTDAGPMAFGGSAPEHLYTNQTLPYFRAPQIYLGIAARFMPGRRVLSDAEALAVGVDPRYAGDCSDVVLLTSRGGHDYARTFMEAYVKPGIGPEHWTSRTNYPAHGLVQTGEETLSFYVQERYGQPDHRLRRYTLRPDGFAALHAGYEGGEGTTVPLRFAGKTLYLNFATSAAGSIAVELQDEGGHPLEGYTLEDCTPVIGNFLERPVQWKGGDLGALAGQTVRVRFVLKDADLFALQFR